MTWKCIICGQLIFPDKFNLPASKYWRGSDTDVLNFPDIQDYVVVFCSPEHSLEWYESQPKNTETSRPSSKRRKGKKRKNKG